jgi:hypothetical protein
VVAIAVFLALGFAFYVFFVPFVGGDELQYVVVGLYTPLVSSQSATTLLQSDSWCASSTECSDLHFSRDISSG